MSQTVIQFYPSRRIIAANPPTNELYTIEVTLSQFDLMPESKKQQATTLGGLLTSSYYYNTDTYQCQSFINPSEAGSATTEEMEMFLWSVDNAEEFILYDIDTEQNLTVQKLGSHSRTRESARDQNQFGYQFNIREVVA